MKKLLINIKPAIKALEMSRSTAGGELMGSYKSRFRGKGIEFEEYQEYAAQDDSRLIDWKASVRSNKILIKEYAEERNLRINFLVDVSNSMVYTTKKKLKAEYASELVISLAYLMIKSSDHVGFELFTDKIKKSFPPKGDLKQYYYLIQNLTNPENYGGGYDLASVLKTSFAYQKTKTTIMLVSDFIGLHSNWAEIIKNNSKRFDILVFMIRDPADRILPKTKREVILKDPFSNKRIVIAGEKIRERYERYVIQQEEELERFFTNLGVGLLRLDTSKSFVEPVVKFFHRRNAGWK